MHGNIGILPSVGVALAVNGSMVNWVVLVVAGCVLDIASDGATETKGVGTEMGDGTGIILGGGLGIFGGDISFSLVATTGTLMASGSSSESLKLFSSLRFVSFSSSLMRKSSSSSESTFECSDLALGLACCSVILVREPFFTSMPSIGGLGG